MIHCPAVLGFCYIPVFDWKRNQGSGIFVKVSFEHLDNRNNAFQATQRISLQMCGGIILICNKDSYKTDEALPYQNSEYPNFVDNIRISWLF